MTDSEILNWIQEHLTNFRHTLRDEDKMPYDMEWIDDEGVAQITEGGNIRECVLRAIKTI
jgi:hypothetical protein